MVANNTGCELLGSDIVCSNHGNCVDAHCDCQFPYTGLLCSVFSPEAITLIVIGILICLGTCIAIVHYVRARKRREAYGTHARDPLLQGSELINPIAGTDTGTGASKGKRLRSGLSVSELHAARRSGALQGTELPTSAFITEREIILDKGRGAELGTGMFSAVVRGTYRGTKVAVKSVKIQVRTRGSGRGDGRGSFCSTSATPLPGARSDTSSGNDSMAQAVQQAGLQSFYNQLSSDLEHEAELMSSLRHPNIVTFMGLQIVPAKCDDGIAQLKIVTEFCERGSLMDVNKDTANTKLTWRQRHQLALGAASGMLYLHSANPPIIHRDLKSPNVLVTGSFDAKIADFGMTRAGTVSTLENTLVKAAADFAAGTPSTTPTGTPTATPRFTPPLPPSTESSDGGVGTGAMGGIAPPLSLTLASSIGLIEEESSMDDSKFSGEGRAFGADAGTMARSSLSDALAGAADAAAAADSGGSTSPARSNASSTEASPQSASRRLTSPQQRRTGSPNRKSPTPGGMRKSSSAGSMCSMAGDATSMMTAEVGTVYWCAPELLKAMWAGKTRVQYSEKVDVYAFGIVLWEICTRHQPLQELKTILDVYEFIVEQNRRPELHDARQVTSGAFRAPSTVYDLIIKCWAENPARRPSMKDIHDTLKSDRCRDEWHRFDLGAFGSNRLQRPSHRMRAASASAAARPPPDVAAPSYQRDQRARTVTAESRPTHRAVPPALPTVASQASIQ